MVQWKPHSEFGKNVITLFAGSTLAQALPIAVSPILTRLYTPDDFGVFAVFFSLTTLFSTIITARYELAIVLPHEDHEAVSLEKLCFLLAGGMSFLLLLIVFIFHDSLLELLGNDGLDYWLYAAPFSIFFSGIIQTLSYRLNRNKKFKHIALLKLSQTGSTSVTHLVLGWLSYLKSGLIVGTLMGQGIAITFQWKIAQTHNMFDLNGIKRVARKYKNFALYNMPAALLDKASTSLPVFFLSRIFDKKITGFFGLVERVIGAPVSLISYSFSQVLLEDIATRHKNNLPVQNRILRVLGTLFVIGLVPFSILFFYSPQLFAFVFGQAWLEAGEYGSVLSIAFFMRFCISPLSMIFIATNNLKTLTLWQVLYFVTSLSVIVYCIFHPQIKTFLLFYTVNEVVLYLIYLFLIIKSSKKQCAELPV